MRRHEFRSEVEQAIELISTSSGGVVQDFSPIVAEFLRMRIAAATDLIDQFSAAQDCPIEFPDTPFPRFLRWLLIDWWNACGRDCHAAELILLSS